MKPRNIHINNKILKWKFHRPWYAKSYVGLYDGKYYYRITMNDLVEKLELDPPDLDEYFPSIITPGNIKRYYLECIKN